MVGFGVVVVAGAMKLVVLMFVVVAGVVVVVVAGALELVAYHVVGSAWLLLPAR